MEMRYFGQGTPITAVQGVLPDQIERPGNRLTAAHGEDQEHSVGHSLAQAREEVAGQIGMPPFAGAGILVEGPKGIPVAFLDVGAVEMLDRQSFEGERSLLSDGLALARRQGRQKIVEASVTLVQPVKLAVGADEPAGLFEQAHFGFGDESGVRR